MPRQRDIVRGVHTAEELRRRVAEKTIATFQPYRVDKDKYNSRDYPWVLYYVSPVDESRERVMVFEDKATANDLRELLEQAWVRGRLSRE